MKPQLFFIAVFSVFVETAAHGQLSCRGVFTRTVADEQRQVVVEKYGEPLEHVELTPNRKFPVIFKMADHESLVPTIAKEKIPVRELKKYDVVIVGGGPAGLTAALYLVEAGRSVLIIERNSELGGLGMGSELKGIRAGGGAAYSAGPDGAFEYKVFQKIGLGQYKKKISIKEPIDSYLWNGKLYEGIWEEKTLQELPTSFALFKHALLRLGNQGAGRDSGRMAEWADSMSMAKLVRQMPNLVSQWKDVKSKKILAAFKEDSRVANKDPMKDVIDLMNLYGRSALGGSADQISARQFVDFYVSEIYTRYTGTLGTGTITEAILNKLKKYPSLVEFRTSAPVARIENTKSGALTTYADGEVLKEVSSGKVIFAAPLALAPSLVKDLQVQDPEKVKTIHEIQMTDYAVHVVRVKGHPYRASYDTWVNNNNDLSKPTDFILGRWQDPGIDAYEGMREFQKNPKDEYGVITIYQPLGPANKKNFNHENSLRAIESSVENVEDRLSNFLQKDGQKLEVELVESYRWPYSIHMVSPGYLKKTPILARPVGNIHFANNTVAAPELESAMARGAQEALNILESSTSVEADLVSGPR